MPTTILANRYNTLRNNVNLVLGISDISAPNFGYGQGFSTNSVVGSQSVTNVVDADKVTAQDYEDLYIDLIRTRSHQVGAAVAIDEFVVGDEVGDVVVGDEVGVEVGDEVGVEVGDEVGVEVGEVVGDDVTQNEW